MKNLINIDIEKYEKKEYKRTHKSKVQLAEKRSKNSYQLDFGKKKRKPRSEYSRLSINEFQN